MAVDYGVDISDFPDLDPMLADYTGRGVLLEALYRRLTTPRGSLFYDQEYGYDITDLLGESFDPAQTPLLQAELSRECLKDERVLSAEVVVTYTFSTQTMNIGLFLQDGDGPFSLVLAVDQVSVTVLKAA